MQLKYLHPKTKKPQSLGTGRYSSQKDIPKRYWTIGEVAEILGVFTSCIRYYLKEFPHIQPRRDRRNERQFTKAELEELRYIRRLVHNEGYTLQGVHRQIYLRDERKEASHV